MVMAQILEKLLPTVKRITSLHPAAKEAFQIASQIVGPKEDWNKNKGQASGRLIKYFNDNNGRIEDALDELRPGSAARRLADEYAPGLADEAEREIQRLAREQRKTSNGFDRQQGHSSERTYTIFPVNH